MGQRPANPARLRTIDGDPAEALAAAQRADPELRSSAYCAAAVDAFAGHRLDSHDPEVLRFEVDGAVVELDPWFLADDIEPLTWAAIDSYAAWRWLGFVVDRAIGVVRPWPPEYRSFVRVAAGAWCRYGPDHLLSLDDADVFDRWAGDLQILRDADAIDLP